MGIEYERKFRADREAILSVEKAVSGEKRRITMQTVYYDTPDHILSANRCTLRKRLENGVSICTLKTPSPTGGRSEYEVPCDTIESAIPILCKLSGCAALLLAGTGVVPVCGAAFERTAITFTYRGTQMELALDVGKLTGGGREAPLCEIEIELKDGSRTDVDAFSRQLAEKYGLTPEPKSKYARAKELKAEERHV